MTFRVERFTPERRNAFLALHSDANGAGWCRCVAWWVPTWEGFADRTAAENTTLRESLCDSGEYDGLLAYDGETPVGWCQLGPRDRLRKLVAEHGLELDPAVWAVSCFLVAPAGRRAGVAHRLLEAAIEEARGAGASRLEGYPRRVVREDGDLWTGSAPLFAAHGFAMVREGSPRSVFSRDLR